MPNEIHNDLSSHDYRRRLTVPSGLALLLLSACSGKVVSLGENLEGSSFAPSERCRASTTAEGSFLVDSQEQINDLAGCEVITGDLEIEPFRAADLRPLFALRRVEGALVVGSMRWQDEAFQVLRDGATLEEYDAILRQRMLELGPVWLESLEGLERLESVGSLSIEGGTPIRSLQPLSGLREITQGSLVLTLDAVEELSGLENIRGVTDLVIGGVVRDMTALRLPASMQRLHVASPVDALDVSALESVSTLSLDYVALRDLGAFSNLERVGELGISYAFRLEHLDALADLTELESLTVDSNAALARLPDFASVSRINTIIVQNNLRLVNFPSFPAMVETAAGVDIERFTASANPQLESLRMPPAWKSGDFIVIRNNMKLPEIDFGGLERINRLFVEGNDGLERVKLDSLAEVGELYVMHNPLLSPGDFEGFGGHIENNARLAP